MTERQEENGKIQIINIYTGGMVEGEEDRLDRFQRQQQAFRAFLYFPSPPSPLSLLECRRADLQLSQCVCSCTCYILTTSTSKVRTFAGSKDIEAGPHKFKRVFEGSDLLSRFKVRRLDGMFRVWVGGWVVHYDCKSPHKARNYK